MIKVICVLAGLFVAAPAFADDGFKVGGVGTFGGSATNNPITENGWPDLNTYRQFRDLGYQNTPADADLANNALAADNGTLGQAKGSNCVGASYGSLKLACGLSANSCQQKPYAAMSAANSFNNVNPCLSPGYFSYSTYQTASSKNYTLTQADASLYAQAAGADAALKALCPGNNCATTAKNVFQDALLAQAAGFTSHSQWVAAVNQGYSLNASDYTLYAEAQTSTYDVFCTGNDCGTVSKTDFQSAKLAQVAVIGSLDNASSTLASGALQSLSSIGVNTTIINDLTNNNTCGTSGNQNCLAAFNAQKASSSCTLAGGSSASAAQMETYFGCVMREHHVAVAAAVSVPTANVATGNSCTVNVNGPVPSMCAHPQWSCSIVGSSTPSGWAVTQSSGLSYASIDLTTSNGAPVSASYTVRASLGIYSPAYTVDYTYNVNVPASSGAGNTTLVEYSGGKEIAGFWNHCLNQNGVLATEAEILAHKNWNSLPTGLYLNGNYNPYKGFVVNKNGSDDKANKVCGSSYSTVPYIKSRSSGWGGWSTAYMRGAYNGTRLKYRDANGNLQTGNCRTVSYRTATFFCKTESFSCN